MFTFLQCGASAQSGPSLDVMSKARPYESRPICQETVRTCGASYGPNPARLGLVTAPALVQMRS